MVEISVYVGCLPMEWSADCTGRERFSFDRQAQDEYGFRRQRPDKLRDVRKI